MSDKNDFDFEDDFLSDDNEPFDFDEEEGFPSGLGDEFGSDMPVMEEEAEDRGPNRTFVFLAGIMIILFVAALGLVLFLATQKTGPSDLELTASQVVLLNLTVDAQLAGTSTQNAADAFLTQTAAAWTATPTETPLPSQTPIPSDTLVPSATEFRPTVTPTPSQDLTQLAILQLANGALTLTQMALDATDTPSPAPTDAPVSLDLRSAFATQVAYATQQGAFDQDHFGTLVAIATQVANTNIDPTTEARIRTALDATQAAVDNQQSGVATAIAYIDGALATVAVQRPDLATQLALVIPAGLQTQAALGTPFAQATVAALSTQAALATLSADLNGTPSAYNPDGSVDAKRSVSQPSRAALATEVAMAPLQQDDPVTQTAAVLATRSTFATQAAQATRSSLATQASGATQQAFQTPPFFATQAGLATQMALQTRQALIDMALGQGATATPTVNSLDSVNMTATAIAGAFLTATAQAFTPGASLEPQIVPTAFATQLPQTGIFEDVTSGGSNGLGVLALTVVGLVGVIAVSRRLRSSNSRAEMRDSAPPLYTPPPSRPAAPVMAKPVDVAPTAVMDETEAPPAVIDTPMPDDSIGVDPDLIDPDAPPEA